MQEEIVMEEHMDFLILSSTVKPKSTTTSRAPRRSEQEQEMWDRYALGQEDFCAGMDHTIAAAEERKRLERESAEFDLWHGANFLAEDSVNDAELLLDELEQDDILSELLRNARQYISSYSSNTFQHFRQTSMRLMWRTYLLKSHKVANNRRLMIIPGHLMVQKWWLYSLIFIPMIKRTVFFADLSP